MLRMTDQNGLVKGFPAPMPESQYTREFLRCRHIGEIVTPASAAQDWEGS